MKNEQTMEERFADLRFATCPTEEKEPFFWRWSEHGKKMLLAFIKNELALREREIVEEVERVRETEFVPMAAPMFLSGLHHACDAIRDAITKKD